MEAVAYEVLPYLNPSKMEIKRWINDTKGIICFREARKTKVLKKAKHSSKKKEVPIWEKVTLTLEEAAEYKDGSEAVDKAL